MDRTLSDSIVAEKPASAPSASPGWVRFDRNEIAGSFGDIGTDLPLLVAMIPAAGLDGGAVFIVFGLMQIATGLAYGLPMPMQPLKAMAALVIGQSIAGNVLLGAGLAIGLIMLALSLSGALEWLARVIPRPVVRGVQFGLGLLLAHLALTKYVPAMGLNGYYLAAVCFVIGVLLWGNRRLPAGILIVLLGLLYALLYTLDFGKVAAGMRIALPAPRAPSIADITTGFWLLALPQIPLSLSNAIIGTHQTLKDLFPHRRIGIRKIGLTYAISNLLAPWFGGVPVCHGCGGLAGHYAFGARTGGSVIIYGSLYVMLGLLFSGSLDHVCGVFPQPVLGVILLFESLTLLRLVGDVAGSRRDFTVALLVGVICLTLPQGFVIGTLVGIAVLWAAERFRLMVDRHP